MDLLDAFDIRRGAVVAAVGGGGKTSLVYELGIQAAGQGLSAIISSTTKFTRPVLDAAPEFLEASEATAVDVLRDKLAPGRALAVSAGRGDRGRLLGFSPETIDGWAGLEPGLIALEADGSAHRPFKAPAEHEPVIPSAATDVIVCVGMEVLGNPLEERYVHRPEIVARLARTEMGAPVTIDTVLRVLTHDEGGRKGLPPGARLHALLNAPQTEEQRQAGIKLAGRLIFGGFYRAIAGNIRRGELDTIAC